MSGKIKIAILDDHQMLIDGLTALVRNEKHIEIITTSVSPQKMLDAIAKDQPDIILSDINMPEMSGIEFTRKVCSEYSKTKVIALSMFGEKSTISEMLDAGASGYILKNTGKEELLKAIEKVAGGGMFFSDEVAAEMMKNLSERAKKQENEKINFTDREKEIILLITQEFSNAQIAEKLFISERTVETHRKNIFRKANTKTVVGLVKFAIEHKLI